jgi:hypothetical protein
VYKKPRYHNQLIHNNTLEKQLWNHSAFHLPNEKKFGLEKETKVEFELVKNPLHETYYKDFKHRKALLRKMKGIKYLTNIQH